MTREDYVNKIVDYESGESTWEDYANWTTEEIQELYIFYFGKIN